MKWLYRTAGWQQRRRWAVRSPGQSPAPRARRSATAAPSALEVLERRQLLSAAVDATFGVEGRASYDAVGLLDEALTILPQSDGSLLAAGQVNVTAVDPVSGDSSDRRGLLMRIGSDGTLDRAFGDNGFAIPRADHGDDFLIDQFHALTVQPDGKILVAGSIFAKSHGSNGGGGGDDSAPAGSAAFAVGRYNADGTPDDSFGDHGVAVVDFGDGADVAYALTVQPDGQILAAGTANVTPTGDRGDFAAVRLDADGKLDKDFGQEGLQVADFGGADALTGRDEAHAIALEPDGSILLAGTSAGTPAAGPGSDGFGLVRLTPAGGIDPTFGAGGFQFTRLPGTVNGLDTDPTTVTQLFVQGDGHLLAGGTIAGGRQFRLVRYNADGSTDAAFGEAGVAPTPAAALGRYVMQLGADNVVTVAGIDASSNGPGRLAFFRTDGTSGQLLDSDGPGDATGIAAGTGPGYEQMDALAFVAGGKLVAAGRSAATAYAGEGEAWLQTNDALVRRFTLPTAFGGPAPTPAPDPDPGPITDPPTPVPPTPVPPTPVPPTPQPPAVHQQDLPPDFSGSKLVKSGNSYKFDLTFSTPEAAAGVVPVVVGPNGYSQQAVVTKTKTKKNKKTGSSLTTVSFRVNSPGKKFEATDNGTYQVLIPPKDASADPQSVGEFQVQVKSKKPKGRSRSEEGEDAEPTSTAASLLTPAQVKDLKAKGWTTFKWRGKFYIAKAGTGIYEVGPA